MRMCKSLALAAVMTAVIVLTGCKAGRTDRTDGQSKEDGGVKTAADDAKVVRTYEAAKEEGIPYTYYELDDGTWLCEDTVYQYRLELTGRLPNAVQDSRYVVLTDNGDLTCEDVFRSHYSSVVANSMKMEGSVIVEWR